MACNSGAAKSGKKSFAEQFADELSAQGIKFKSVSGRTGEVAVLPGGSKVTKAEDGNVFSQGEGSKIVVRNRRNPDGSFVVNKTPYKNGTSKLRSDLDGAALNWLPLRPGTLVGRQGDHTTAFTLVRRGIATRAQALNVANNRQNAQQLLAEIQALPGHDANTINNLQPFQRQRYHDQLQATTVEVAAYAQGNRTQADLINALETLENFNPLATVTDGSVGAGEGHAMLRLNVHEAAAVPHGIQQQAQQRADILENFGVLFDTHHADVGIQNEIWTRNDVLAGTDHPDAPLGVLPGVRRGANGEIDVTATRLALAERHARFAAAAFPNATARVGGEQAVVQHILNAFATGGDRSDPGVSGPSPDPWAGRPFTRSQGDV